MKENYTDITMVLDRSGSMENIREQTIRGFNKFLAEQKGVPHAATITLVQFDDRYDVVYEGIELQTAPELTRTTFMPRGSTALLDALGRTIQSTGKRLAALAEAERPDSVIFVTLTDGYENCSTRYDKTQINDLIFHQRTVYNWEFVFLGANQDAIMTASQLGIQAAQALTYAGNAQGVADAFDAVNDRMTARRLKAAASFAFSEADRAKQAEAAKR